MSTVKSHKMHRASLSFLIDNPDNIRISTAYAGFLHACTRGANLCSASVALLLLWLVLCNVNTTDQGVGSSADAQTHINTRAADTLISSNGWLVRLRIIAGGCADSECVCVCAGPI